MKNESSVTAQVSYQLSVINTDGSTARVLSPRKNLLLDRGLDEVAGRQWCSLFDYFAIGTGSNPTSRDSGLITFSIAGSVASSSSAFFQNTDIGRILKLDTGEEMRITGYTDAQHVGVAFAGAAAAAQGTIWHVTDTALTSENQRFNQISGDTGDHGYLWSGVDGKLSTWTTRVSNTVTDPAITFKEIGWSHSGYGGDGVNGRDLINGGAGDTLVNGQKYKVKLQLDRTISPLAPRACPVIAGWGGSAQEAIETVGLSHWASDGRLVARGAHEPSSNRAAFALSATSAAFRAPVFCTDAQAPDLGIINSVCSGVLQPYTAGSFYRDIQGFWDSGFATAANIRSILLCEDWYWGPWFAQRMLMDADHAKTSADKLTVTVRRSWGRILVN